MPTRAFRALGAGCLALAGCWLSPVSAQAVEPGVGKRSATVRAVSPRHAKHQRAGTSSGITQAKPAPAAKAEPASAAESTGAVTTAWTAGEPDERACFKSRRKL